MDESVRRGRRPIELLTDSQRRVLRGLRDSIVNRGFPPTMQELAGILGVPSATAPEQIGPFVRKRFIRREYREARGVFVAREAIEEPMELASVPLLGNVPAGAPLLAEESILGEVMVGRRLLGPSRSFALRIVGASTRDAAISDGAMIIVRKQQVAKSGDILVALLNDDATVQRLSIREHEIELPPANPDRISIPIRPDDELRIVGKVVAVRKRQGG